MCAQRRATPVEGGGCSIIVRAMLAKTDRDEVLDVVVERLWRDINRLPSIEQERPEPPVVACVLPPAMPFLSAGPAR